MKAGASSMTGSVCRPRTTCLKISAVTASTAAAANARQSPRSAPRSGQAAAKDNPSAAAAAAGRKPFRS